MTTEEWNDIFPIETSSAREKAKEIHYLIDNNHTSLEYTENTLIEFAQYHVTEALKVAAAQLNDYGAELNRCYKELENSILTSYPLNKIK